MQQTCKNTAIIKNDYKYLYTTTTTTTIIANINMFIVSDGTEIICLAVKVDWQLNIKLQEQSFLNWYVATPQWNYPFVSLIK